MDNKQLKVTLDLDDDEAAKAWGKVVTRIINLDMQLKALPPHVLKSNPRQAERTERDYLTEYLQQERVKMHAGDVTKGLIKEV